MQNDKGATDMPLIIGALIIMLCIAFLLPGKFGGQAVALLAIGGTTVGGPLFFFSSLFPLTTGRPHMPIPPYPITYRGGQCHWQRSLAHASVGRDRTARLDPPLPAMRPCRHADTSRRNAGGAVRASVPATAITPVARDLVQRT